MLIDNFEILIFSDKELNNADNFLERREKDIKFWSKIWGPEDFYIYAVKQEIDVHEIKSFAKKLFGILREGAFDKRACLVVYDEYEIVNAIDENYKIIEVTDFSKFYDFIYRFEQSNFLPLMVYKFRTK